MTTPFTYYSHNPQSRGVFASDEEERAVLEWALGADFVAADPDHWYRCADERIYQRTGVDVRRGLNISQSCQVLREAYIKNAGRPVRVGVDASEDELLSVYHEEASQL